MTLLAYLIAKEEGFGKPGAIPTVRHNPGDLRHSPDSQHPGDPNAIGTIDTDAHGWGNLERDLGLKAARGETLEQAIFAWAPKGDGANDPAGYLSMIIDGFAKRGVMVKSETPLSLVLRVQA